MKKFSLVLMSVLVLVGCQDRVIWNDNGKLEDASKDREIWDSNGQVDSGERKIWVNKDGKEIIK